MALRPSVVGMALAEPGRFDDGAGDPDPSLLHVSMVFVHPAPQRLGVGLPLVLHVRDIAGSHGYQRAPFHAGTQLQYGCLLDDEPPPPPVATP